MQTLHRLSHHTAEGNPACPLYLDRILTGYRNRPQY